MNQGNDFSLSGRSRDTCMSKVNPVWHFRSVFLARIVCTFNFTSWFVFVLTQSLTLFVNKINRCVSLSAVAVDSRKLVKLVKIKRISILKYRRTTCIETDALSRLKFQIKVYIPFNFLVSYSIFTFNMYVHTQMKVFFRYKKEVSFKSINILIWKFKNNNYYYYIRLLHISFIHHNLHIIVWLYHRKYQLTCLAAKPLMAIKLYIKVKNPSNRRENFIDYANPLRKSCTGVFN